MAYYVDRVVICDAYAEPIQHYRLLTGGRSKLVQGRRPSVRFLASAKEMKGGIDTVIGREAMLFEELSVADEQLNDTVNQLRDEVRAWRTGPNPYQGTALVTRRLLEWWFEREDERRPVGKRFFFCQREAIETVIYLYEVKNRHKMPETGDLLRYALKLATGTGKTVVMALLITWATLHRRKVSGSSLSNNFLVLVPNLTVRDRVSGASRGDGLDPSGAENLYGAFDTVPPEYRDEFHPNVTIMNWQAIPLDGQRDDWLPEDVTEEGRFIPASVLWALQRRHRQDTNGTIRRFLNGWRDLVIINDEAHHVYGEKRTRQGEEPEYIKWSKIIGRIAQVARITLTLDLSATPWYGSGSPKPDGTLFEWLVSDFSVYDAFESGLVKIVRLPEEEGAGRIYLDLWDGIKDAKSKSEYLSGCKGALESLYSDWKEDFNDWISQFEITRGPSPVMLVVASDATRASWVFERLTQNFDLLRNPDDDDRRKWVTIQIDSQVFDANKGNESVLREMVSTVGKQGMSGEHVRCIVSVNMLSEGWDVKSVTHILGLRAFGSSLLTEQIIGRGLRRTNYDVLNQPLSERTSDSDETVDALGIPFVGFPVEKKRKRPRTGSWDNKPIWIEKDASKEKYRLRVPNVRSWAVGVTRPLSQAVDMHALPELIILPQETPPQVAMRPIVGGSAETVMRLDQFRAEYPLLRSKMTLALELYRVTSVDGGDSLAIGPTFDELLELTSRYVDRRVGALGNSDKRDIGVPYWQQKALDILETAIRSVQVGTSVVPILGTPDYLDTNDFRRFQWTGIPATGRKCHTNRVACHSDLERQFADFLDRASDVQCYCKNERFGFSVTYYENNRPRQYYPDFIVIVRDDSGQGTFYIVETKGEVHPNTTLKREAAELWCAKMSSTPYGIWKYLFVEQRRFEHALNSTITRFADLAQRLPRQQ